MFPSVFNSLAWSRYLSFFTLSFSFIQWEAGTGKSTIFQGFFFFCWLLKGLVVWTRIGDPFVCQSPLGVYVYYFSARCWVVHIPIVRMVKFKFLAYLSVDHLAHSVVFSLKLLVLICFFQYFNSGQRNRFLRRYFPIFYPGSLQVCLINCIMKA